MTTINISLPTSLYKDIKKTIKQRGYSSVSELARDGFRKIIYQQEGLTENGFTPEFEEEVLKAAKEPLENDIVLETDEDIDKFFDELHKKVEKRRYGKDS